MQKYKGLWDYYEQLYGNKMDNLEEMDRFLEKFNLSVWMEVHDIVQETGIKTIPKKKQKSKMAVWGGLT